MIKPFIETNKYTNNYRIRILSKIIESKFITNLTNLNKKPNQDNQTNQTNLTKLT